ncbi:hypothetical protein EIN_487480 [Entamoeba invadens IP1]|uniref:Uncharacterized protein n=1 Tax=Entamoeba invadens IP1 TaxID=370355 RepID=A0A0A1U4T7_ENTIV|nr:hypothetical protein EIN_487480 [Entamoeba invadens IP1]ELP89256.1 hypothetical protein EIN_487480 [Entamoeba invadens IP1]|eukprot:XP_004256027.1 hypothetical protein EIN_487480 [Entamoeba invadens IP1]
MEPPKKPDTLFDILHRTHTLSAYISSYVPFSTKSKRSPAITEADMISNIEQMKKKKTVSDQTIQRAGVLLASLNREVFTLETKVDQIKYITSHYKSSYRDVGVLFCVCNSSIHTHTKQKETQPPHTSKFSPEMDNAISALFAVCASQNLTANFRFVETICKHFDKEFSVTRKGLDNHIEKCHNYKSALVTKDNVQVLMPDWQKVITQFSNFHARHNGISAGLLFSISLVPFCDLEDSEVSMAFFAEGQKPRIPFSSSVQKSPVAICTAADGALISIAVVVPTKKYDEAIVSLYPKVTIYSEESGYFNSVVFKSWLYESVLKSIFMKRKETGYLKDAKSVLLCDNYCEWIDQKTETIFNDNGVVFQFLEPHSAPFVLPNEVCLYTDRGNYIGRSYKPRLFEDKPKEKRKRTYVKSEDIFERVERYEGGRDQLEKIMCGWRKQLKGLDEKYVKRESTEKDKEERGKIIFETALNALSEIHRRTSLADIVLAFKHCGYVGVPVGKNVRTYVDIREAIHFLENSNTQPGEEVWNVMKVPSRQTGSVKAKQPTSTTLERLEEIFMQKK